MTTPTELRALLAECREWIRPIAPDCDAKRALLARITAALAEKEDGGWLPIETAPEKRDIQITDGEHRGMASMFRGLWNYDRDYCGGVPTHWQPLSPLPERK